MYNLFVKGGISSASGPMEEHFCGSACRTSAEKDFIQPPSGSSSMGRFTQSEINNLPVDPFEPVMPLSYLFGCYLIPLTRSNCVPNKDILKYFYELLHKDFANGEVEGDGMKGNEVSENSPEFILKQFSSLLDDHCPRLTHEYTNDPHPGRLQLPFFSALGTDRGCFGGKNFIHLLTPQRIIFFYPKFEKKDKIGNENLSNWPSHRLLREELQAKIDRAGGFNQNCGDADITQKVNSDATKLGENDKKDGEDEMGTDEEYRQHLKWFFNSLTKKTNQETKLFLFNFLFREEFIHPVQFNYLWDAVVCLEEDIPDKILEIQAKGVAHYANLAGLE